jgi:hypothetical protein
MLFLYIVETKSEHAYFLKIVLLSTTQDTRTLHHVALV